MSIFVKEYTSVLLTVELALALNPHKNKHSVVRKACNKMKWRMSTKEMHDILEHWGKSNESYTLYLNFLESTIINANRQGNHDSTISSPDNES
jgi:hypothetical protein